MQISFHGATRGVTGSCHLVQCGRVRILVDCGLYQGGREIEEENADSFGFDAAAIDYVLLTHAHLDHCGRLPLLAKRGFKGEIISTPATAELARIVLLDAAHLQEEELLRRVRRAAEGQGRSRSGEPARPPLYGVQEALRALELFGRAARYDKPLAVCPGVTATFLDAGHILGSASILLELHDGSAQRRVLFSGDLGNSGRPLLRDPATPPHADVVVMETTYGDRRHKPIGPSVDELHAAISTTFTRGGNVVIPTFALERAQEILFYLREGIEARRVPSGAHVFLDSPMAISATEIFHRHPECYDDETAALFRAGRDPFRIPGLHFTRESSESIAINRIRSGAVILAGSGMCTGGRVRHHLRHLLGDERNAVVFVGFAAIGTLARRIIDGAKWVRIHDAEIPVRAAIHTIGGFSAHADQAELLAWHQATGSPRRTFLVHGEERVLDTFRGLLASPAEIPQPHESFAL